MSLEDRVVITCSISGAIANREQCPAIPYTPQEYGAEARRIVDEGGNQPAHAIGLARFEIDAFADWMEEHAQGQFLVIARMD